MDEKAIEHRQGISHACTLKLAVYINHLSLCHVHRARCSFGIDVDNYTLPGLKSSSLNLDTIDVPDLSTVISGSPSSDLTGRY